jgi:hypothetical protein
VLDHGVEIPIDVGFQARAIAMGMVTARRGKKAGQG